MSVCCWLLSLWWMVTKNKNTTSSDLLPGVPCLSVFWVQDRVKRAIQVCCNCVMTQNFCSKGSRSWLLTDLFVLCRRGTIWLEVMEQTKWFGVFLKLWLRNLSIEDGSLQLEFKSSKEAEAVWGKNINYEEQWGLLFNLVHFSVTIGDIPATNYRRKGRSLLLQRENSSSVQIHSLNHTQLPVFPLMASLK